MKEELKRKKKFCFPSNELTKRWNQLTDYAETKSDNESEKTKHHGGRGHTVGPQPPDAKLYSLYR